MTTTLTAAPAAIPGKHEDERNKPRIYKPELDTLRFFAFLSVFVAHTMQYPVDFLVQHHVPLFAAQIGVSFAHAGWFGVACFLC